MAKKSSTPEPSQPRREQLIEDRVKAREEAVQQDGETPPPNQDVNEAPVNPKLDS